MKISFREYLKRGEPIVGDGGMGTSLYERGFYINRSFEELCLTNPRDIESVMQEFKSAGSNILSTNTFGANTPKLSKYGLQSSLREILESAVKIASAVASDECYVAASMGPLGLVLEPLGPTAISEAKELFKSNAEILNQTTIDCYSLETFHDLVELEAAIRGIRAVSDKPIMASIAVQENHKTSYGHSLKDYVRRIGAMDIDVIGLNCQVGPTVLLDAVEQLRDLTHLPISVAPNAGLPRFVNDRYIYMCSPDYLGKYAKRFIQAGAQIVGGCCGTNHHHIRAISNAVRMQRWNLRVSGAPPSPDSNSPTSVESVDPKALEKRSALGEALHSKSFPITVELVPPVGVDTDGFLKRCRQLKEGGVKFVNIPDAARAMARMSSLHLAVLVKKECGLEPIPHFTSRDRNLISIQGDLIGAHANGIRNILLVTGDPPKLGNCPDATAVYDVDAIGMTHIVNRMNHGKDLGGSGFGRPAEFVLGVAINPTSVNPDLEKRRFHYKVEAGADYAITQPIYDLEAYQRFMDTLHPPKDIPIIMGIWPLVSLKNAEFLKHEVPGVSVPDWVIHEMEKSGDNKEEALKRGLEIAIKTMEQAQSIASGFQVSAPFNRVDVALQVIHAI